MGLSYGCSSANGSATSGIIENSVTHGYAPSAGAATYASSRFELDAFPRALTSRLRMYNADSTYKLAGNGGV